MGKQSGRLYYNGEDHYDLVFEGEGTDGAAYNHSKMYFGNKLIWKREMPKFLMIASRGLATTETFSGISEFPLNPFESLSAISFFEGCYFLASGKKIYISANGYDWRFIHEIEWNVRYMERITDLEALIIITQRNIIYCKSGSQGRFTFENKYELNREYSDQRIPAVNSGKRIFIRGMHFTNGNILPGIVIANERIYETDDRSDCYAGKESNCFYRYVQFPDFCIERSYDAIVWNYFCDIPKIDENGNEVRYSGHLFEYGGFLCMFIPSRYDRAAFIIKMKEAQTYGRHIIVQKNDVVFMNRISILNDICILGYLYYDNKEIKYAACVTNDIFSTYYDGQDFINTKPVKLTGGYDSLQDSYGIDQCVSKDGLLMFYSLK